MTKLKFVDDRGVVEAGVGVVLSLGQRVCGACSYFDPIALDTDLYQVRAGIIFPISSPAIAFANPIDIAISVAVADPKAYPVATAESRPNLNATGSSLAALAVDASGQAPLLNAPAWQWR